MRPNASLFLEGQLFLRGVIYRRAHEPDAAP